MKQRINYLAFLTAPEALDEKITYAQFVQLADPGRLQRSGQVRGPPLEIYADDRKAYHIFNFKANPSTTGFRHRGYVAFQKPKNGKAQPAENLPVEVDCDCEDYRYRWAWANHQRGAGPLGRNSLNKCINKAPVHTNPSGKPALCKHLLAARRYVLGLIQKFPKKGEETDVDVSWKIHQLVKRSQHRYDNYGQEKELARKRAATYRRGKIAQNIQGPMPPEDVPPNTDDETPPPLPPEGPSTPPPKGPPAVPKVPPVPGKTPPKPIQKPVQKPVQKPLGKKPPLPPQKGKKPKGGNKNPNECRVVKPTNSHIMNRKLLSESKAILEEMGEEMETGTPGSTDSPPPGGSGEFGGEDIPLPEIDSMGGPEAGGGEPEDEALQLLREIAGGITRLADEIAPVADEAAGLEGEGLPGEEGEGEGEKPPGEDTTEEEPGVPPVEDDEDEFQETMPVSTGA